MTRSIHTDEMVALRNWLKNQRKAQKITMRTLAERMGRQHSFVQRVEEGDRRLDLVEYVWYCSALGIDPQAGLNLIIKGTSFIHS